MYFCVTGKNRLRQRYRKVFDISKFFQIFSAKICICQNLLIFVANEELMLLEYFRKLNNAGQLAAISVVRAYSVMSEYAKKEKSEAVFG